MAVHSSNFPNINFNHKPRFKYHFQKCNGYTNRPKSLCQIGFLFNTKLNWLAPPSVNNSADCSWSRGVPMVTGVWLTSGDEPCGSSMALVQPQGCHSEERCLSHFPMMTERPRTKSSCRVFKESPVWVLGFFWQTCFSFHVEGQPSVSSLLSASFSIPVFLAPHTQFINKKVVKLLSQFAFRILYQEIWPSSHQVHVLTSPLGVICWNEEVEQALLYTHTHTQWC